MLRLLRLSWRVSWSAVAVLSWIPSIPWAIALAQDVSPALRQADAAYRAGQAALGRNDLAMAQADFAKVVRLAPGAEQGHSALGAVLISRGHPKEAIHELETALALQKTDTIAQMNLAVAYQQVGVPAKAIPLFAALEARANAQSHPLSSAVLASYAQALAAAGSLPQAAARMKAAVESDPQNATLHDDLGSLYAQLRDWPAAQQQFVHALRLNPELASAHLHLGLAMQAEGQPECLRELERAAQLAPGSAMISLELGKAYAAAGQDDRAVAQFRQVLDRQPDATPAMLAMALALQRQGKVPEAIALLQRLVVLEPKNADALANLGVALTQTQQAKDAVTLLQRSIALAPRVAVTHQNLAAAYVQLNQLDDAIRELHTALKLTPDASQLHYDLGLALKLQDHPDAAIPELETAQRLDAASFEAPFALGMLYLQEGRYAEAADELKRSLDLRPQNGDAWATLGSVYNKLDRLPEATAALREATHQLPEQPDPHLILAAVLTKQNLPAEALVERKKAAELMRANMNRQRAEVATNAGNGSLKNGDLPGAEERFRDALTYDASYPDAHRGLAKVLDAQGKAVEAAAERARAEAVKDRSTP
jgi:tetratricopeptide (TPR) repeat protein